MSYNTRSKTNPSPAIEIVNKSPYMTRSKHKQIFGSESKNADKKTFNIKPCSVKGCVDQNTHTKFNHACLYCDEEDEDCHLHRCPLNKIQTDENTRYDDISKFPQFATEIAKINKKTKNLNRHEYTVIPLEQGCACYVRNNAGYKQYLFMYTDDWGQYGQNTSHLPRYKAFIHTYSKINIKDIKKY